MFPIFDKKQHKIHLIGAESRLDITSDAEHTFFVTLRNGALGLEVLFTGAADECEHFIEQLYFSMCASNGDELHKLAGRAVSYAKDARQREAA